MNTTLPPSSEPAQPSPFRRFLNLIGLDRSPDTTEDLEQEIQELIDDGEEQGLITPQEGKMINSILEFKDTLAREIMTPRTEMISAPASASAAELIAIVVKKGFSRIPVYADTPDHIIGILYAKDLLKFITTEQQPIAKEIVRPPFFALENQKITDLLRDFQARKIHLAVITDEFGNVRGLVTLEDILEEIVGEIDDESDSTKIGWQAVNENTLIADAKIDIEEIETYFNVSLPEGRYESLGGFVLHQLGYLPKGGENITVNNLMFTVLSATQRRINKIRINRITT